MTQTSEFYRTAPVLVLTGGADFDFRLTFDTVRSTSLDGRVTSINKLARYSFEGWSNFSAELRSDDGTQTRLLSVVLDGPATDGTLRIRGRGVQTWALQQAGVSGGRITLLGTNPAGQRPAIRRCRFRLETGATSPTAPSVSDYTLLR